MLDSQETDVDCGGSCAPCNGGLHCLAPGDCASARCADGICEDFPPPDGPGGPVDGFPELPGPPDLLPAQCPLRPMGEWHVSPLGSDVATQYVGNGSSACPLQTLVRALALAQLDGFSATSPSTNADHLSGRDPSDRN